MRVQFDKPSRAKISDLARGEENVGAACRSGLLEGGADDPAVGGNV